MVSLRLPEYLSEYLTPFEVKYALIKKKLSANGGRQLKTNCIGDTWFKCTNF